MMDEASGGDPVVGDTSDLDFGCVVGVQGSPMEVSV